MSKLRVVELFAGVGGFRLGLEGWKGKSASSHYEKKLDSNYQVVWSNQWEPSSARSGERQEANMVYQLNWPDSKEHKHYPNDINLVCSPQMTDKAVQKNIPEHDLLVGGFPCQDYSVAGVNSKGIEGKKGVLWWNIYKLIKARKPKMVFLENVDRMLKSPTTNRGRDFAIMLSCFYKLGYNVEWRVINAAEYGMPQRRRRVYILAYKNDSSFKINDLSKWLLTDGVFSTSFPFEPKGELVGRKILKDPAKTSDSFKEGKFFNAGVMKDGETLMCDCFVNEASIESESYSSKYHILKNVLIQPKNGELKDYIVDKDKKLKKPLNKIQRPDFPINKKLKREGSVAILETEFDKWIYLKGKKAEERVSSKGKFYYTEGPLSLTDDLKKPSRTIITSEGGPGASRFKHLIEIDGTLRRLHPIELERLNMFPDNHTEKGIDPEKDELKEITPSKRAFFMGNALVVGIVEKVGKELNSRINEVR